MDIKTNNIVYLDYASTTPVDERVVETMLPFFNQKFGNAASRTHAFGWESDEAVKESRLKISSLIGARPDEIVFTSGATEAINLGLKGVFESNRSKGAHLITVATEHKAVLDTCKYLETLGVEVTYLPVDQNGCIDLDQMREAITNRTVLISVMYANNETGVINPIREIAHLAHSHDVLFMTDATQALGKVPINMEQEGIDLLTCSAHKLYGPKGVGALCIRKRIPRTKLIPLIHGGGHERGFRSGTLNIPGIVGFGKACEIASIELLAEGARLRKLRLGFEEAMRGVQGCHIHAEKVERLPHITNFFAEGVDAEALIMQVRDQLAIASGSACTSAEMLPSHVIMAMHHDEEIAYSSVRISLGRYYVEPNMKAIFNIMNNAIEVLRNNF